VLKGGGETRLDEKGESSERMMCGGKQRWQMSNGARKIGSGVSVGGFRMGGGGEELIRKL